MLFFPSRMFAEVDLQGLFGASMLSILRMIHNREDILLTAH